MNRMLSLWIALAASWVAGLVIILAAGGPLAPHAGTTQAGPNLAHDPDAGP